MNSVQDIFIGFPVIDNNAEQRRLIDNLLKYLKVLRIRENALHFGLLERHLQTFGAKRVI